MTECTYAEMAVMRLMFGRSYGTKREARRRYRRLPASLNSRPENFLRDW